jgi:hypothetical protein
MNIEEETLIKYIKSKYPKIIFNPVKLNGSDLQLKSHSLGFIVSDNKLIIGYINSSGELCKLIEPVDLSNLSHTKFIEIISKLPIVDSDNKSVLVNLLDDKDVISKSEHNSIMEDMKKLLELKESEYNILVNTDKNGKIEDQILIKKEYESKINDIKIKYDDDIYKLKEDIRKSEENKDICKTRLLNEKDIIINGIKDFKNRMTEYISQIYKEQKENGGSNKLNELYMNLQNEKAQVENNMNILTEREKEHLQKIENDKSVISDYEGKLNLKSDEIANLNNVIKDIQKELNKVQDQFSQAELEKTILAQFKKVCIEMILNEKEQIINKIKEYNLEWLKWVNNNNVNVRHQKEELKNDLNIIFTNLKKLINSKNEYLSSLDLSLKDKDKVESQLNLNISDIKAQIKNSLNEQITQLSSKNQDLETEISKGSEIIKNKDAVIKELKIKLEDVKKLLEKNESTPIVKTVDYKNCNEVFQKFININNMFFRKKQVLNILDDIINSDKVPTFTHLNDDIKNNIKSKYYIVKDEILKHIDFLDLNKYITDPNITLFKNKDTKHISPAFCNELNTISDYWDNNLGLFREQDRLLTNIYEDLSGAVRVYIRIKPRAADKTTKTVYIEGKNKKVVVDCSEVENINKKETFGEFYGVFDTQFSNKDVYTGIEKSGNPVDLKIDLSQIVEDNATVSPGLYSAFQQVEDGYSIVIFGYGLSGSGKCLGRNTPILMYDGTIKMVQDVIDGDLVMGDDSRARRVFGVTRGRDTMYKIRNEKGEKYIVNSEHILSLKYSIKKQLKDRIDRHSYQVIWFNKEKIGFGSKTFSYKNKDKSDVYIEAQVFYNNVQDDLNIDIPVQKYISLPQHFKEKMKGYKVPVDFPHRDLELDPYMIGFWLGDGTAVTSEITTQDSTVLKYFAHNLAQYKCYLQFHNNESNTYGYRINGNGSGKVNSNYFMSILRKHNLLDNKHIPHSYKCNTREQRLQLLAGILDADGSYDEDKRIFEFSQGLIHETLFDDVVYLCRSLGFACYKNKKKTSWTYLGVKKYGEAWRICISGEGIENIPTKIKRKQAFPRRQIKDVLVSGITVQKLPEDDYFGFAVDGNHRFLLGNFTVTHNTFSLLGQNGMPGILHFGLANLQGVQQIKLKYLFEQYINNFTPTLKLITGKIINLINHVPLGGTSDETKEFATHLSSTTSINTNKLKVDDINKITDSLEKYRIQHSRVKKTPNNPVSSRSHLYMVFEIIFENGKTGYITIVDTAGRESPKDIYNLFIDTTIKRAPTFTTILGPTGGPGVISQYIKEEYKEKYDPNDIYAILKEGVYINETINHLIYFFNKKNNKPDMHIKSQGTLDNYSNDKFYVSPENADKEIIANNNCYMIPILKFLDNLSNRKQDAKDFKPTKFIVLLCVRSEEAYCNQIFSSLEFGNKVKSS